MSGRIRISQRAAGLCPPSVGQPAEGEIRHWQDEFSKAALPLGVLRAIRHNAALYREGDASDCVYRVVSGAIRTSRLLRDGRRQIVEFYLPCDLIGLDWQSEHGFTAEAITDATVMSYPRAQLEALSEQMPAVCNLLLHLLARSLFTTQEHLVMLGRQTARERIAWLLLSIMRRTNSQRQVTLPMRRMDIADYLGLTIETVSRELSELKRRGYIDFVSCYEIVVKNNEMLHLFANGEIDCRDPIARPAPCYTGPARPRNAKGPVARGRRIRPRRITEEAEYDRV
ncbi:MAG TPA: helix-turn-helix domain-containing protein [Candidatus Binatia bacterium]|nr:helix-turn-helix domain-containing protein [Candidatus Binatia bacterium]